MQVGIEVAGTFTDLVAVDGERIDIVKVRARRRDCFEVTERLDTRGDVIVPLDEDEVRRNLVSALTEGGYDAVAICLLSAYAAPAHEQRVAELLRAALPRLRVACSHLVAREFREFECASTTVLSAYVQPVIDRYLRPAFGTQRAAAQPDGTAAGGVGGVSHRGRATGREGSSKHHKGRCLQPQASCPQAIPLAPATRAGHRPGTDDLRLLRRGSALQTG